jgi:hypothetical protein
MLTSHVERDDGVGEGEEGESIVDGVRAGSHINTDTTTILIRVMVMVMVMVRVRVRVRVMVMVMVRYIKGHL